MTILSLTLLSHFILFLIQCQIYLSRAFEPEKYEKRYKKLIDFH